MHVIQFWPKAGFGALGAAVWTILIHGVPLMYKGAQGKVPLPSRRQRWFITGLVLAYLALGAVSPFIADADSAKDAFAWGLAWQSVFGESARQHFKS